MESVDTLLLAINREIINPIIIAAFAGTLVYFIFGVIKFIIDKQNGADNGNGRRHMLWGLIGMFIMTSVFGIMQFIVNTLKLDFDVNNPDNGPALYDDPTDSLGAGSATNSNPNNGWPDSSGGSTFSTSPSNSTGTTGSGRSQQNIQPLTPRTVNSTPATNPAVPPSTSGGVFTNTPSSAPATTNSPTLTNDQKLFINGIEDKLALFLNTSIDFNDQTKYLKDSSSTPTQYVFLYQNGERVTIASDKSMTTVSFNPGGQGQVTVMLSYANQNNYPLTEIPGGAAHGSEYLVEFDTPYGTLPTINTMADNMSTNPQAQNEIQSAIAAIGTIDQSQQTLMLQYVRIAIDLIIRGNV